MPLIKEVFLHDFFVHNCLTGADSIENILAIRDGLIKILATTSFKLRKFCSNDQNVLADVKPEFIEKKNTLSAQMTHLQ